jgi:hypothetical protein
MRICEVTGKEMAVLFPVSVLKWVIYADLRGYRERSGGFVPGKCVKVGNICGFEILPGKKWWFCSQ